MSTDLRSSFDLVNQLAEFTTQLAESAEPLCLLMSPICAFTWTPDHELAFESVKRTLATASARALDPSLPTALQPDASRLYDVVYNLQEHKYSRWGLAQCGSRILADVETMYASIELELSSFKSSCNGPVLSFYSRPKERAVSTL